jgi:hypothetical protein
MLCIASIAPKASNLNAARKPGIKKDPVPPLHEWGSSGRSRQIRNPRSEPGGGSNYFKPLALANIPDASGLLNASRDGATA